jgi:hypothetical protein
VANDAAARAAAARSLSQLVLPPGAVASGLVPGTPAELWSPTNRLATRHRFNVHRIWRLPGPPDAAINFIESHRPAGSQAEGSSETGSGRSGGAIAVHMATVLFSFPAGPGAIISRQLAVEAVALPGGGTALRADGEAGWAPRQSAAVRHCWRPPHDARHTVAPSTNATPGRALTSLVGVLRRPATADDHVSLRGLVYTPITAIYARYVRVVRDAAGERFALVPAQVCGRANGGPYPARPPGVTVDAPPQDTIFVIVLGSRPPRALFDAGAAPTIASGRSIGEWSPEGDGSLIATVVPDNVSRVTFSFGAHRRQLSLTVRDNLAVRRPSPGVRPAGSTWYGPDGHVIRRLNIAALSPQPSRNARGSRFCQQNPTAC